jgi:hypothetical protein
VADVLADPDSDGTLARLVEYVDRAVEADPGLAATAVEIITGFYRRQADAGEVQALVDLGDFLYWDRHWPLSGTLLRESCRARRQRVLE